MQKEINERRETLEKKTEKLKYVYTKLAEGVDITGHVFNIHA